MTPDKTPTPTDAELMALVEAHLGLKTRRDDTVIDPRTGRFHDAQRYRGFARAVLAKWGSPVATGEPVAWWIPKAEQFAIADKSGDRPFAKAWEPLYATPQPTQAPVPHTCAGFRAAFYSEHQRQPSDQEVWVAAIHSYRDLNPKPTHVQAAPTYPSVPAADKVMTPSHAEPYALWGLKKLMDYAKAYHAAQAQAVPLTEEQIGALSCRDGLANVEVPVIQWLVREVEYLHGITPKQGGQHE